MNPPFAFDELLGILGSRDIADVPCPVCSPFRKPANRRKPVLRLWQIDQRLVSFHCCHCEASGHVWKCGRPARIDPQKLAEARRQRETRHAETIAARRALARSIYARRQPMAGTLGELYFCKHRKITCRLPATTASS